MQAAALLAMIGGARVANAQDASFYTCDNKPVQIDIPSMPLDRALARFTRATHCPVSIDIQHVANSLVNHVRTYAVRDRLTPDVALARMLASSPLRTRPIKGGFSVYHH